MTQEKLLHIISLNESETLDFKRLWKDDFFKTICAFSNGNGGILLLGVDDNKTIKGGIDSIKLLMTNGALFPKELSIDSLKTFHPSLPKNPIIAKVFYYAGLIESWGRGTINMVNDCKTLDIPEPQYDYQAGFFTIIFSKKVNEGLNEGLNIRQINTLKKINENPGIKIKELSETIGIPIDTLDRYIKIFVKKHLVERRGSKKTGGYYVK